MRIKGEEKAWYTTLTREEMGRFLSDFDKTFCKIIEARVDLQNFKKMLPSLRVNPNTSIGIQHDRIVSRCYLVDRNKDKFPKKYLSKSVMPIPTSMMSNGKIKSYMNFCWTSSFIFPEWEKHLKVKLELCWNNTCGCVIKLPPTPKWKLLTSKRMFR